MCPSMRNRLISLIALCLLSSTVFAQESLGDAARRLRQEKEQARAGSEAAKPSLDSKNDAVQPATPKADDSPITDLQLLAWQAAELRDCDVTEELKLRGISFVPSAAFDELLTTAGASTSLKDAVKTAKQYKSSNSPSDPETLKVTASAAHQVRAHHYEQAFTQFQAIEQQAMKDSDLLLAVANCFAGQSSVDRALSMLILALRVNPRNPFLYGRLSYGFYRSGSVVEEFEAVKVMTAMRPKSSEALKFYGLALGNVGRHAEAIAAYNSAIAIDPEYGSAYGDRGMSESELGNTTAAIADYKKAMTLSPYDWAPPYNLANTYDQLGQLDNAIVCLVKAKAIAPKEMMIRQNLGYSYCRAQQWELAAKEMQDLLSIDPNWNMARVCLHTSLVQLGRKEEAAKVQSELEAQRKEGNEW